jgi:hypothetical protein
MLPFLRSVRLNLLLFALLKIVSRLISSVTSGNANLGSMPLDRTSAIEFYCAKS